MTAVRLGAWRGVEVAAPAGDRPEEVFARREAAVDAVVAASEIEVPREAVRARARQLWDATCEELRARGTSPSAYLKLVDKDREQVLREAEPEARQSLAREAVLTAIADEIGLPGTGEDPGRLVGAVDAILEHAEALRPGS